MISTIILLFLTAGYLAGMYRFFEQAGYKGYLALIPVYRAWILLNHFNKRKWWIVFAILPGFSLFLYAHLIGEICDSYRKYSFWEHNGAVLFGWVLLPYWGWSKDVSYHGIGGVAEGVRRPVRNKGREWADAILFAVFAAYFIRTFFIELYTIPTSSMEDSLLVGDFLFVSKMHYGPRVPQTPIAFPLVHHTFPKILGGGQAYFSKPQLPYYRLPGFQDVKRNDLVVFNFPANDTLTMEFQSQVTYYQLVRQAYYDPANGITSWDQARNAIEQNFRVISRPVDKRENYIKRCVGVAGDTLSIRNDTLFIDGQVAYEPEHVQYSYRIKRTEDFSVQKLIDANIYYNRNAPNGGHEIMETADGHVQFNASKDNLEALCQTMDCESNPPKRVDFEAFMKRTAQGTWEAESALKYYPHNERFGERFGLSNYGPIVIPAKGMTVNLQDSLNFALYKRVIEAYEGHTLRRKAGNIITIDGQEQDSYTFEMDYYWMMGDNRHGSQDSRFWGFVPEDHIVGKAWFVLFSLNADQNWFTGKKVRWNRFFLPIHWRLAG